MYYFKLTDDTDIDRKTLRYHVYVNLMMLDVVFGVSHHVTSF